MYGLFHTETCYLREEKSDIIPAMAKGPFDMSLSAALHTYTVLNAYTVPARPLENSLEMLCAVWSQGRQLGTARYGGCHALVPWGK